ncbi:methyltransferase domain-containing protein [Geodermatophilus sabuli]|uniref:Methyltransferase domain-containing protein n=1 Tax=Geodermatophilus sabuli TaxID=1564158 RepID=A0A7K3W6U7_9ACTN|nr:class I SAM-dependent methyltransferase [Geodermatophilus sabuli]NEK59924.1 methyltransferase domain-containing protein [Geodermatophilus sabuli]
MGGSIDTRTTVTGQEREFLPGMAREWLLPLYDPMSRLFGAQALHRRLLYAADLRPGQAVLEIGCGTGNLLLAAKAAQPAATVVGLDPDLAALAHARRKARRRGLPVQLDRGYADALPYPDGSLDVVLSSFMLHHLPAEQREPAMLEVLRVLRPGGTLHLLDMPGPDPADAHAHAHTHEHRGRRGHRHQMERHLAPDIPGLLRRVGFGDVTETGSSIHRRIGRATSYRAAR